jgi:DNA-binding MarR family transcriptional regulator
MNSSVELVETIRRWMDIAMHRSMRDRTHFAKAKGLSMAQFGLLMQLHYRGNCGVTDISERFEITSAAVSQLVEKLVQSNLVERAEDPNDRRAKQIQLSARGRALIEKSTSERYHWVDQLVASLEPKDREKIAEALSFLTEAARRLETEPMKQIA